MKDTDLPAGDLPLTPEDIEEIVSILSKSSYETLDIETARFRLRVSRHGDGWTQEWLPAGGETHAAPAVADVAAVADGQTAPRDDGLLVIRPPMPGTFYRAPQPGAAPFVEVGDRVTPETVVAIVETMKVMNPVHAGVSGQIIEIVAKNAEPIDGNSILMTVQPE